MGATKPLGEGGVDPLALYNNHESSISVKHSELENKTLAVAKASFSEKESVLNNHLTDLQNHNVKKIDMEELVPLQEIDNADVGDQLDLGDKVVEPSIEDLSEEELARLEAELEVQVEVDEAPKNNDENLNSTASKILTVSQQLHTEIDNAKTENTVVSVKKDQSVHQKQLFNRRAEKINTRSVEIFNDPRLAEVKDLISLYKMGFRNAHAAFSDAMIFRSPEKFQPVIDVFKDQKNVREINPREIPEDLQVMQRYNPEVDVIERFVPGHLMEKHQDVYEEHEGRQVRVVVYQMHEDLHAELLQEIHQFFTVQHESTHKTEKQEKEESVKDKATTENPAAESLKKANRTRQAQIEEINPQIVVPLRNYISGRVDLLLRTEQQWNNKMMEQFQKQIAEEFQIKKEAVEHFMKNDEIVKNIVLTKQKGETLLDHPENLSKFNRFVNELYH